MPDIEDGNDIDAARRYRRRLKKQRAYQENYRDRLVKDRRPDREQMAAAVLTMLVRVSANDETTEARWLGYIRREMKGAFEDAQIRAVFIGMVERERGRQKRRRESGGGND